MTKRLLLIDGHSMAYRAFFALPADNFTTAQGQHTNAIYGFATMLLSLLSSEKPTHVAVAFDVSRKTFRSEIFPEYKANRASMPDDLRAQVAPLHEAIKAMGWPLIMEEGVEADDVIGALAKQAESEGIRVIISTGDKDIAQLVNEHVTIVNTMSNEVLDIAGVTNKFGVFRRGSFSGNGSISNTSTAAWPGLPAANAVCRSFMLMRADREVFTKIESGRIRAN